MLQVLHLHRKSPLQDTCTVPRALQIAQWRHCATTRRGWDVEIARVRPLLCNYGPTASSNDQGLLDLLLHLHVWRGDVEIMLCDSDRSIEVGLPFVAWWHKAGPGALEQGPVGGVTASAVQATSNIWQHCWTRSTCTYSGRKMLWRPRASCP